MFGMTEKEFWEDDPQLYWSYRIFYLNQQKLKNDMDINYLKENSWFIGYATHIAVSVALNNGFSKKKTKYPNYIEMYGNGEKDKENKTKTRKEINRTVQEEFNSWARF